MQSPNFIVSGPDYTVHFAVDVIVTVDNGASASASDPVFLTVPQGWTYTLTAIPSTFDTVPEPATLWLLGSGLGGLGGITWRRRRRT